MANIMVYFAVPSKNMQNKIPDWGFYDYSTLPVPVATDHVLAWGVLVTPVSSAISKSANQLCHAYRPRICPSLDWSLRALELSMACLMGARYGYSSSHTLSW